MQTSSSLPLSLLLLLLVSVSFVSSQSNFCLTTATTTLNTTRFIDPDALQFNLSSANAAQCRHLCCATGGCVAFSLATTANADNWYTCLLHQTPLLTTQQSDNYTAALVNSATDPQQQLVPTVFHENHRLTNAMEAPGAQPWTAANCSDAPLMPGWIALEATLTSNGSYTCRAFSYFTSIVENDYDHTSAILLSHAVPQPTPLDYDYALSTHASPIRGWNTYNSYGSVPPESVILANAKTMATLMLSAGYRLVSLDWGWWFDLSGGVTLDETGRYQPAADRFPSSAGGKGLKPLADQLHSMGLLLGVYEDAGISIYFNNTGENHVPVGEQCVWPGNSYFLDWTQPAAQEWLDTKVQQWAEWDVDYVKIDCVGSIAGVQNVFMYSTSIARSSRPDMMLSISPGYNGDTQSERIISPYVDEYRVAVDQHDLWDQPISFYPAMPQAVDFAMKLEGLYAGLPMLPNVANSSAPQRLTFPDMDILPFGVIYSMAQGGNLTLSAFNYTQQRTAFAIWCFYRSPLLYGGRLTPSDIDQPSIDIATNERLLHIHQNGYDTRTIYWEEHAWLVVGSAREELGEEYLLVANINSTRPWLVAVQTGLSSSGDCDWLEVWSGQVWSKQASVQVQLGYAESAVFIIGNCTQQGTAGRDGGKGRMGRTVVVSKPTVPLAGSSRVRDE